MRDKSPTIWQIDISNYTTKKHFRENIIKLFDKI